MKNTTQRFSHVSRHSFATITLLSAFVALSAASAMAQQGVMAATPAPLAVAASPASFAEISAAAPLYLGGPEAVATDAESSSSSSIELPDDPSSFLPSITGAVPQANGTPQSATTAGPVAKIYTKYIPAGWHAQHITARDKVVLGFRDIYSPLNFAAMVVSAGYEQLLNSEPNYGVDRGAFGERLGAAGIRESTQGLFTDTVFAPLLHEDPRYYVEGSQYSFVHRVVYAGTRPLITRTDSGSTSINGALLLGYAASSALTYTYYPAINQNFHDTAATFGGAIGGAALGFLVSEFSSDILTTLHLQKKQ